MTRSPRIERSPSVWKEPHSYDALPVLLIYVFVAVGGTIAVLDMYLPTSRKASTIVEVDEFGSRVAVRGGHGYTRYWSSIDLANGKSIWTQRTANNFAKGDSMDVEVSAVMRKVVRYRGYRPGYTSWYATEGVNEKYRPLPFAAILFALILLLPWWSAETRMLFRGILLVVTAAWLITTIATQG